MKVLIIGNSENKKEQLEKLIKEIKEKYKNEKIIRKEKINEYR